MHATVQFVRAVRYNQKHRNMFLRLWVQVLVAAVVRSSRILLLKGTLRSSSSSSSSSSSPAAAEAAMTRVIGTFFRFPFTPSKNKNSNYAAAATNL